jgi:Domain of unknown function (DUF5666)
MRIIRLLGWPLGSITLLLLLSLLAVGCGTNSTTTGATSSTTATTTPCPSNQLQSATGTIQSISGNTLLIANIRGNTTKATYSSSTRFTRQSSTTVSSLKEGVPVTVTITQNADNTYTATRIILTNGSFQVRRQGTNANTNCFNRSRSNRSGSTQPSGTTNTRSLAGTVGQMNGNTLTVTDIQGSNYTVTITSTTQIEQTSTASAADLKTGQAVTVSGSPDGQGGINARTVTILQKLPTKPAQ